MAQHGLSHTNFAGQSHRPGEFRERDYVSQLRDIARGREILLNACNLTGISTFAPPWNGWNANTAKALKKTGFTILSTDRYYYYESARDLIHIPFTAVPRELEELINEGQLPAESIIVVLYHPFEIVEFDGALSSYYFGVERFERLLQKLSAMPEVKAVTLQQLANEVPDLITIERYRAANSLLKQRSFWGKLVSKRLSPGVSKEPIYLSLDEYHQTARYWKMAQLGLLAALVVMGLLVRYLLGSILAAKWRVRTDVLATCIFCLAIVAELRLLQRGYHITGIRAIPIFLSAGFVAALILRMFRDGESTQQVTALKQCKRKSETI